MSDDKQKDEIIDIEPQVISDEKPPAPKRAVPLRAGLIAGVAVLAALCGMWLYQDFLVGYLPNDQLQSLSMRVDALEAGHKDAAKRVDAVIALTDELKAQLGAARALAEKSEKENADLLAQNQSEDASVAEMKQTLDQAKTDLEGLKTQLASGAAGAATLDPALAQRLDALEKNFATLQVNVPTKLDTSALKQALAALDAKVADGAPFANEFAVVARAVPAADGLDVLKAEAASGVPNAKQLGDALTLAAAQLPKQSVQPAGDGWLDKIGNLFSGLVTIKSAGSDDWSTMTAKCSALVAAGDLQQADALFSGMEGQAVPALATWHDLLQRRIKLEDALSKTDAAVAREIAAKG